MMFVHVSFDIPLDQVFTYQVPESLVSQALPGCRVIAPLGKRERIGFLVSATAEPPEGTVACKEILDVLDRTPPLSQPLLDLTRWVADYYQCSWGEALRSAFPFPNDVKPRILKTVSLTQPSDETARYADSIRKDHPQEAAILDSLIAAGRPMRPADVLSSLKLTPRFLKRLVEKGYVEEGFSAMRRQPEGGGGVHTYEKPALNRQQRDVLDVIEQALCQKQHRRFLLHGVTGSGKTEVYLRAIEKTLELGRTALVLVPEIGLTPQAADRYRSRFGDAVGILHSGLSWGERFDEWTAAHQGSVRVIVGTRSAVFCPLENIGLIVVDEEHDPSYKQDDPAPRYHARDVAAYRAASVGAVAIFGSATPSLESYWNSRTGKYELLRLPERAVQHGLPELSLIDMRARGEEESVLSEELVQACRECLDRSEQAILFLNRRGFATNLLCRRCGETITCEKCSVALVYHQDQRRLKCHHCGFTRPEPTRCPSCSQDWLKYKGVGTEQVVEVVEQLLPGARVGRMDTDTVQTRSAYNEMFSALAAGELDFLVGTQMIAKGLDFAGLSLVGVICADMALFFEDFRAAERTFALMTQVAGRAGRGQTAGKVLIQTYCPHHYSVRAAMDQNYEAFFEQEIRYRKLLSLPPHRRLVNIRVSSREESRAKAASFELSNAIRQAFDELDLQTVRIIGPGECPIYRVRNQFRWQLAIAGRSQSDNARILTHPTVQKIIRNTKSQLKITVDVDPQSFL